MGKENPPLLPDGSVNVWTHLTTDGRDSIHLGENADGTHSTLPGYIEIDGVQITAEKLNQCLDQLAELENRNAGDDEYFGVLGIIKRYLGDEKP